MHCFSLMYECDVLPSSQGLFLGTRSEELCHVHEWLWVPSCSCGQASTAPLEDKGDAGACCSHNPLQA